MANRKKDHALQTVDQITASGTKVPVIGIGASAGGLSAFEDFFSGIQGLTDPNMAFVLVQHLDPNHKSALSEIIQRQTKMQVFEVEDGMQVKPNCIYIIPPNHDMALLNGALQLMEPSAARGHRLPIDFFFNSLAQDQQEHAIGIVLSGTGRDGTEGIKAIKKANGLVIAQAADTAEFNGMPNSAIQTGLVDYELAPDEMPDLLIAYTSNDFHTPSSIDPLHNNDNDLKKIFVLLRAKSGHDFSLYKPSTIKRRIKRRMAVNQIDTLSEYVKYLDETSAEQTALFKDMLIGVTNFFRDSDAFEFLQKSIVPKLFKDDPANGPIRIWVAGCSTGEEAYSIAIVIKEAMLKLKQSYAVQIFATDIDAQAITTARVGVYPASITLDVSKQRLEKFFTADTDADTYHINKDIREMIIFSEHNVTKDPPFSKLDLISCRNLMIYMNAALQNKLISLFHYALKPKGTLFLGTSETIGQLTQLFTALEQKLKFFERQENVLNSRRILKNTIQTMYESNTNLPKATHKNLQSMSFSLRELTEQMILQQLPTVGVLVDEIGDILYLHGHSGRYLEVPAGETTVNNILKMAREGLQDKLSIALKKVISDRHTVRLNGVNIKTDSHFTTVDLTLRMVPPNSLFKPDRSLYLIIIEETSSFDEVQIPAAANAIKKTDDINIDDNALIAELKHKLRIQEDFLQDAHERFEISNEELKASNEEIQSMNEELQSSNEELETSKEELQSVNEELTTVNDELQSKVEEFSRTNNDMHNLLVGTNIGTVFLDNKLSVLRFTPAVTKIMNLITGDIGRPIAHIVTNLVNYNRLVEDTQSVLNTLIPFEAEVKTNSHDWYLMRIHPYRTTDNVIEGAVISFFDITDLVGVRKELATVNSRSRLALLIHDSLDVIIAHDIKGTIIAWNPEAARAYGWSEDEALTMNIIDMAPETLRNKELRTLRELATSDAFKPYLTQRLRKDGTVISVSVTASALRSEDEEIYAISTTERIRKNTGRGADNA